MALSLQLNVNGHNCQHMPNIENIEKHKWKKGQSGNPSGRPSKVPELKLIMAAILSKEKNGKNEAEAIIEKMVESAKKGCIRSAEFLFNHAYGKPTQRIEMAGEGTIIKVVRE